MKSTINSNVFKTSHGFYRGVTYKTNPQSAVA